MTNPNPTPPLASLNPTDPFNLDNNSLCLLPRIKLHFSLHRSDTSLSPLNDWSLKTSLLTYLKTTHSIPFPEDDAIKIKKFKNLNKRKRGEAIGRGTICIGELGFLRRVLGLGSLNENVEKGVEAVEKRFLEWRKGFVEEMDGMELSLEGVKFKLSVELPKGDDFQGMRKEWEEMAAFGVKGYPRDVKYQPDTIVLRGMPSRWFAEPRVSSKPSMLVSHTIFSVFGNIRNLHVAEDDGIGKDEDEGEEDIVPGLNCKIVVRFEKHKDFYAALKVLSGRSLHKKGSRLRADYDVTWDKDDFFRNARSHTEDKSRWKPAIDSKDPRSDGTRHHSSISRFSPENSRKKRLKE
ncbi:hypothetical protein Leryth_015203 [Lithospermum erythrorhizon]|nr:hypothetical protein Leryth_015203 [Lithospermum erythrorhizon]